MDPIPALVRRFWDVWDLQLLVLLSLTSQIILSLFGNRRKYISSRWISILLSLAYTIADWVATAALGKLSDAEVVNDNGSTLRAIWAPLLLLHLGGPDTITVYSLEDNHLIHLLGLVVQFSVAVYVILMSWKQSWFSIMSIPALVAGFIKYGERTWVLWSVSHDKSGEIVPFGNVGSYSNLGNNINNTWENKNSTNVLCIAHASVKAFKRFSRFYDIENNGFEFENLIELDDISLFWNAIEVEMGLMFDLLYTKAPLNFKKRGCILRCITFSCTVTVLIGLVLRLISTGEDGEKWDKVDIAITEVLLVGALALEIYAIISLYLFSDWAMLWLIKQNRAEQVIRFRKIKSWLFFLPKEYRCKMVGQFDLLDFWLNKPDQKVVWSLLGIKRWLEEYFKDMLKMYVRKSTADIVPSLLFDPILHCCRCLTSPNRHPRRAVEQDPVWREFFNMPLEEQIINLHVVTEVCYNLEMEWDTDDAADQNNRDGTVSQQHTMPGPSDLSSSWKGNRELCRTLSRYMMYLLVMHSSLLPIAASDHFIRNVVVSNKQDIGGARDVRAACRYLLESDWLFSHNPIVVLAQSKQKDMRWDTLKLMWVRMLCYAASKGQRNEHFQQLSQGGEFLTFLWFFLPQSRILVHRDMARV